MSEEPPTWLDEFVQRIPDSSMRTDFLRYWVRLKRHNENDELLMLVNFMGVLTAIMSTIPQEALRLARELPHDPVLERLETCRAGWEKFLSRVQEPVMCKRLDRLGGIIQNLERIGRHLETRLILALVIPSYLAGCVSVWLFMQFSR
jgi:hypothetical protein